MKPILFRLLKGELTGGVRWDHGSVGEYTGDCEPPKVAANSTDDWNNVAFEAGGWGSPWRLCHFNMKRKVGMRLLYAKGN